MTRSKDIAFISPPMMDMLPSGVTTFIGQLKKGLAKHGDRFKVIEVPHGEGKTAEGQWADNGGLMAGVVNTPRITHQSSCFIFLALILSYLVQVLRDIKRVWKVRKIIGTKVIVTNHFGCETLPIACRVVFPFSKIMSISHTHPGQDEGAKHFVRTSVEKLCLWCVSEVIFNSAASRDLWKRKLGVAAIPGHVVHLGAEPPDLTVPEDYPQKPDGTVDFVCVARFVRWKGQMNLLRAWGMLRKEEVSLGNGCIGGQGNVGVGGHWGLALSGGGSLDADPRANVIPWTNETSATNASHASLPRARLIFIGDGECFNDVKEEAERLKLGNEVVFLGYRPRGDLYFNGGDVAVLASCEPEAFGLVLLEAMSRGKPVLASMIGGVPEIVADGRTGLLVSPNDIDAWSRAMVRLAGDAALRETMGKAGQQTWAESLTCAAMIKRFESVLRLDDNPTY